MAPIANNHCCLGSLCKQDSRIQEQHIQEVTDRLKPGKVECYLCGPSPMIASIETMLKACGITEPSIHYERWW